MTSDRAFARLVLAAEARGAARPSQSPAQRAVTRLLVAGRSRRQPRRDHVRVTSRRVNVDVRELDRGARDCERVAGRGSGMLVPAHGRLNWAHFKTFGGSMHIAKNPLGFFPFKVELWGSSSIT